MIVGVGNALIVRYISVSPCRIVGGTSLAVAGYYLQLEPQRF
jgi:hypothetical protein